MVTDEEKDKGGNERESGNNTNVFEFQLAQRLSIKMVEDNQVCIQGHCECPEHVSYWKPIFRVNIALKSLCQYQQHTSEEQSLGIDIVMKSLQLQVH